MLNIRMLVEFAEIPKPVDFDRSFIHLQGKYCWRSGGENSCPTLDDIISTRRGIHHLKKGRQSVKNILAYVVVSLYNIYRDMCEIDDQNNMLSEKTVRFVSSIKKAHQSNGCIQIDISELDSFNREIIGTTYDTDILKKMFMLCIIHLMPSKHNRGGSNRQEKYGRIYGVV